MIDIKIALNEIIMVGTGKTIPNQTMSYSTNYSPNTEDDLCFADDLIVEQYTSK